MRSADGPDLPVPLCRRMINLVTARARLLIITAFCDCHGDDPDFRHGHSLKHRSPVVGREEIGHDGPDDLMRLGAIIFIAR